MLTVERVWREALPAETRLVAGEEGLAREVSWAVTLRPRPPAFGNLKGGELTLLSVPLLRVLDPSLTLARAMESLSALQVAGVGALGEIDEAARRAATSLKLPLLGLPASAELHEIERSVVQLITEHRTSLYQHSQDLFRQLADLAIHGRGVPALVERLCQVSGRAVILEDVNCQLRAFCAPQLFPVTRSDLIDQLKQQQLPLKRWLDGRVLSPSDPPVSRFEINPTLARLVSPVVGRDGPWGYLSLVGGRHELTEVERLAVARAAAACAIEIARENALLDAQDRLQSDLMEDLLAGIYPSAEGLLTRARRLGHDLERPHAGLALHVAASPRSPGREKSAAPPPWVDLLEHYLRRAGAAAPLRTREDTATLLYPLTSEADETAVVRLAERLQKALEGDLEEGTVSLGVGGLHPTGLDGLRLSCQEAEQSLDLGRRLFGEGSLTVFGRLGLYRLLLSMRESPQLRDFYQDTLGKLLAYDHKNGADLVPTLEALLAANNSPTEAAQRMHLHRNTLLYRLRRIEQIAGISLNDPETRLALHLALRIGQTTRVAE